MQDRPKVTIDTSAWLNWLDKKASRDEIDTLLVWHAKGLIRIVESNRLIDPETWKMDQAQQQALADEFKRWNIEKVGNVFRLDVSRLNGLDVLDGHATDRAADEIRKFRRIVGEDPT